MQDFDDSSDEEDVVELSVAKISDSLERFDKEVSQGLTQQIKDFNEKTKESSTSGNTLYTNLNELKIKLSGHAVEENEAEEGEESLQQDAHNEVQDNNLVEKIDSLLVSIEQAQEKLKYFEPQYNAAVNFQDIKSQTLQFRKSLSTELDPLYTSYNEVIDEIGESFLLPALQRKAAFVYKGETFTTAESTFKTFAKIEELKKKRLENMKKWVEMAIEVSEEMQDNLKYAQSVFENIDLFLESSTPGLAGNIELSFVAHFIGTGLLHHPVVKEIYHGKKYTHLHSAIQAKDFHHEILKSGLIIQTLTEFLGQCESEGIEMCEDIKLPELILSFQEEVRLRQSLKMMNGLNDFIFFRTIYEYVDKTKISFSHLLKMTIKEIREYFVEEYPLLRVYSAAVVDLASDKFDVASDDMQIDTREENSAYQYKGCRGYIYMAGAETFPNAKIVVHQSQVIPKMVDAIYCMLIAVPQQDSALSLKKHYSTEQRLIEGTWTLVSHLPAENDFSIIIVKKEPVGTVYKQVESGRVLLLQKLPQSASSYKVYFSSVPGRIEEKEIDIPHTILAPLLESKDSDFLKWIEEGQENKFEFEDMKDEKFFRSTVIAELENQGCPLIFDRLNLKNKFLEILFGDKNDGEKIYSALGSDFLRHIFLLMLRKKFYNTMNLDRTVLPDTFIFSVASPPEFLSAIRLSNRSLTRLSRNLLQNPSTLFQVRQINSGSEPLVSVARTWHFAEKEGDTLSEDSCYAVDRQIVNTKRSEKKTTLLSREHYVAEVGSYSSICNVLQKERLEEGQGDQIKTFSFMPPIFLGQQDIKFFLHESSKLNARFFFSNLYYLVFGVEAIRNPASFVLHAMLIELVVEGRIKMAQLFHGSGIVKIEDKSYTYINGLLPTAPKLITARSRELNNLFHRYMPNPYIYPGDLSREQNGFPNGASVLHKGAKKEFKLKLGLNHLIYREALVMKMWCKHNNVNPYQADEKIDVNKVSEEAISYAQNFWKLGVV